MLLKILWCIDAFVLFNLVASISVEQPKKGKLTYITLYIILIGTSYFIKETYPKMAILLASIPVLIPIFIFLFLIVVFNLKNVLK
jgi:hypothetical protein